MSPTASQAPRRAPALVEAGKPQRMLVIGGDAAGMAAAHQARRVSGVHGAAFEVSVLEATREVSYAACGLPYWVAGDVTSRDALISRTVTEHRERGVAVHLDTRCIGIDLAAGVAHAQGAAGATKHPFDLVVFAMGARAATGGLDVNMPGVFTARHLADGERIRAALETHPEHVVIIGGGYIGVEMAEAFVARERRVTMVIPDEHVLTSMLDEPLAEQATSALTDLGVVLRPGVRADGLEPGGAGVRVSLDDGTDLDADIVIVAVGVTPNTEIAQEAGLEVGASGALRPDARQRVADHVWAAGDCCEVTHRLTGKPAYIPLATHAVKAGRVAGTDAAGGRALFPGAFGTGITRIGHTEIAATGLRYAQLDEAGVDANDVVAHQMDSGTAAGYMPQAQPLTIAVLARRSTGQLLGVQLVGGPGTGKRIDTAVMALAGGLDVEEVAYGDLAYAPPFATTWDAVQIACRAASERL